MRVSRGFSVKVQYVLDQWIPPIMRDSKWFMYLPMKLVLRNSIHDFMHFKNWVFKSSEDEFGALYERTNQELQGETDLNQECLDEILKNVQGKKVLEVGCGRGFLANKLTGHKNKVTACDIVIADTLSKQYPEVTFDTAAIESLPYKDKTFDVVVSTHTLEHVKDVGVALSELRRVAKEAVIIVVPKQRPYKYTFSLHTQFFPYKWSVESAFGVDVGTRIKELGGDWFYHQTVQE